MPKKGFIFCLIIMSCIMLYGCGKQDDTMEEEKVMSEDVTYECQDMILRGISGELLQCRVKDKKIYILTNDNPNVHLYKASADGNSIEEIQIQNTISKNEKINFFCLDDDSNIYMQSVIGDQEGLELVKLNDSGTEIGRVDLKKELSLPEMNLLRCFTIDGSGNVIVASSDKIYILNPDMRLLKKVDTKKEYTIVNVVRTNSGNIICGMQREDFNEGGSLCMLDTQTLEWGEPLPLVEESMIDENCLMEAGEYDFYYKDASGIYGYNDEKKDWTTILDARCSLLTMEDVKGLVGEDENIFFGLLSDSKKNEDELIIACLSKKEPEEDEDMKIITYAGYNVPNKLRKVAREFNKLHKDCKIEIKLYEDEERTKMSLDMAAGKVPDIIPIDACEIPAEQLIKKNVLEDLTPYFEKDTEFTKDDIIPSVLEGMKVNDRLYYLSTYFQIISAACNNSDCEGKNGWTIEEVDNILEKRGDGAIVFDNPDKEDMLCNFLISCSDDYINWQTGECFFSGQEFKNVLELCNSGYITDQMSDKEYADLYYEIEQKMRDGKVLMSFSQGVTLEDIYNTRQKFGADISYIGLPEKNRQGSYFTFTEQYGIYSGSDVKKEAWDFIKMVMSEEYQINVNHINYGLFPTRKDALEWKLQAQTATEAYEDSYGNWIEPVGHYADSHLDEEIHEMPVPSKEDVDTLLDLIERTKKHAVIDNIGISIVMEEASAYFNGKKSVDKVAEIIQKRMTTYVNEQK